MLNTKKNCVRQARAQSMKLSWRLLISFYLACVLFLVTRRRNDVPSLSTNYDSNDGQIETEINEIFSTTPRTVNVETYYSGDNTTAYYNGDESYNTSNLRYFDSQEFKNVSTCSIGNDTVSLPIFPHFIIVGAQKAGTTAISTLLDGVPNFLGTIRREAHYWDKYAMQRKDKVSKALSLSSEERCASLRKYFSRWNSTLIKPNTILFEKTPSLLAIPHVPEVLDQYLPHKPKIIVILRNPVDRLCSQFKMEWTRKYKKLKGSFDDKLILSLDYMRKKNVIRAPIYSNATTYWNQSDFGIGENLLRNHIVAKAWGMVPRGFYAQQIRNYMKFFSINDTLKVIHYESFQKNKTGVLQELVRFVGGPSSFDFKEEILEKDLSPLQKKRKKDIWTPLISNNAKNYLKHLYKPYNDELADLLGESWRGVWD